MPPPTLVMARAFTFILVLTLLSLCESSLDFHGQKNQVILRSRPLQLPGNARGIHGRKLENDGSFLIPGAYALKTKEEIQSLRQILRCLSNNGRWKYNPMPRRLAWPFSKARCDYRHEMIGGISGPLANSVAEAGDIAGWRVRPSLKYEWVANDSCGTFDEFDKAKFCRLLQVHGDLLVVGDSISNQLYSSLYTHLGSSGPGSRPKLEQSPHCSPSQVPEKLRLKMCNIVRVCEEFEDAGEGGEGEGRGGGGGGGGRIRRPVYVRFIRNDYLTVRENKKLPADFNLPWLHFNYSEHGIGMLVLNQGAHYWGNDNFTLGLTEAMAEVRRLNPNLLIVYRNTPPGHANCTSYRKPLKIPQDPDAVHMYNPHFHWANFTEQNELAKAIVEPQGAIYMDVDYLTKFRADAHMGRLPNGRVDCLHFCAPGPVDTWTRQLYIILSKALGSPH